MLSYRDSLSRYGREAGLEIIDVDKSIHRFTFMSHTDGCIKPLIIHFVWSVVSSVSTVLLKIQVFCYPLDGGLGRLYCEPGKFEEERHLLQLLIMKPQIRANPSHSMVTILTQLSWLVCFTNREH